MTSPVLAGNPPDFSKAGQIVRDALGGQGGGSGLELTPSFYDLVEALKFSKGLAGLDTYATVWNQQFYRPALRGTKTGGEPDFAGG